MIAIYVLVVPLLLSILWFFRKQKNAQGLQSLSTVTALIANPEGERPTGALETNEKGPHDLENY